MRCSKLSSESRPQMSHSLPWLKKLELNTRSKPMAAEPTPERLNALNAMPAHRRATAFRLLRECWDAGELSWEPGWCDNMIADVTSPSSAPAPVLVQPAPSSETRASIDTENPVR